MKSVLKILGGLLAVITIVGLGLYAYGATLPESHRLAKTVRLNASQEVVWSIITDYQNMPQWWDEVASVEEETRPDGTRVTWNLDKNGDRIGFITAEAAPPTKLVRKILDDGLPFGGVWMFELAAEGDATQLTLTEDGFVTPPFFRAVMELFVGQDATMDSFLAALDRRLAKG